jgi:xanthine/CO dehydrogenase XdhC/CoxF family maturation factor
MSLVQAPSVLDLGSMDHREIAVAVRAELVAVLEGNYTLPCDGGTRADDCGNVS